VFAAVGLALAFFLTPLARSGVLPEAAQEIITGTADWRDPATAVSPPDDAVGRAVHGFFLARFREVQDVADRQPPPEMFRAAAKPLAETTPGFYDASLIGPDFVIRQVYDRMDGLAVGYDLKKVKPLREFWRMMREQPGPQLSEPARGMPWEPRLTTLRVPFFTPDGKLAGIVSLIFRTSALVQTAGLESCPAWRITCRGQPAESQGTLPETGTRRVTLRLPATEWVIDYVPAASKKQD